MCPIVRANVRQDGERQSMSLNANICCVSLLTLCWPDPKVFTPTYCQALSSGLQYKQEKFLTLKSPILIIGNHLTLLGEGSPVFRRVLSLIPPLNVGGGGRKRPRLTTYSRNIVAKIIWRSHNDTNTNLLFWILSQLPVRTINHRTCAHARSSSPVSSTNKSSCWLFSTWS